MLATMGYILSLMARFMASEAAEAAQKTEEKRLTGEAANGPADATSEPKLPPTPLIGKKKKAARKPRSGKKAEEERLASRGC